MSDIIERLRRLASQDWAARYEHDGTFTEAADEIERLRAAVLLAAEALKVARPVMEWARDTGSRDDREVALWALSRIDAAIHSLKQEGG